MVGLCGPFGDHSMRYLALAVFAFLGACSAPPPVAEHGCLKCAEAVTRTDEARMCPGVEQSWWEPVLSCRCAPSAPCASKCEAWCKGGGPDSGIEADCAACTKEHCQAALAACEAH